MKILGSLFRLLCAFVVLLALAVYLGGPLQVSLVDYLGAFTPENIQSLADSASWPAIAAGALVLLALCCGMKLGWNLVYSLATLVFFAEVALLTLGPDIALPSAIRGLGWEPMLRELALNYPVPTLMIPCLCVLGCLCSTAPVRIAGTSLISCLLFYGLAELCVWSVQGWAAPLLPETALELLHTFPWVMAALPAIFFVQYCLFMALFETFSLRRSKHKAEEGKKPEIMKDEVTPESQPEKKKEEPKTEEAKPEVPAEDKKEEPRAEEAKPEVPAEDNKEAPKAEEAKPEAPAEDKAKEDTPATPAE